MGFGSVGHGKRHPMDSDKDHDGPWFDAMAASKHPISGDNAIISAQELKEAIQGLDWQDSVLSMYDASSGLPADPSDGDRYLCAVGGSGWTLNNIYEWNDAESQWDETVPNEGFTLVVEDVNRVYTFTGSWQPLGNLLDHALLMNLDYNVSGHRMPYHPMSYHVSTLYGIATNRDGTEGMPFRTIPEAINAAVALGKTALTVIIDPQTTELNTAILVPAGFQLSIVSMFSAAYWAMPRITGALQMNDNAKLLVNGVSIENITSTGTNTFIYVKAGQVLEPALAQPNCKLVLFEGAFCQDNYYALSAKFQTVSGYMHETGDTIRLPGTDSDSYPAIHAMGRSIQGIKDNPTSDDYAANKKYVDQEAANAENGANSYTDDAIDTHAGLPAAHHMPFYPQTAGGVPQDKRTFIGYLGYEEGGPNTTPDLSGIMDTALDLIVLHSVKLSNLADNGLPIWVVAEQTGNVISFTAYKTVNTGGVLSFVECETDDININYMVIGDEP